MENYDAYSAGIFPVTINEVSKLAKDSKMSMQTYCLNLLKVKSFFGDDVTEFTLKTIPKHLKRNGGDSACLLVFRRASGNYYAKRHNNSQFLNIEA